MKRIDSNKVLQLNSDRAKRFRQALRKLDL